jgi:hypothetical protein
MPKRLEKIMNNMYTITQENAPTVMQETVIDGWLTEEDIELLYERWKSSWPIPLEFSGGVKGITCEAVMQVPTSQLNRTFGKVRGTKLRKIAEENYNA